jgi:hypothetical protein
VLKTGARPNGAAIVKHLSLGIVACIGDDRQAPILHAFGLNDRPALRHLTRARGFSFWRTRGLPLAGQEIRRLGPNSSLRRPGAGSILPDCGGKVGSSSASDFWIIRSGSAPPYRRGRSCGGR